MFSAYIGQDVFYLDAFAQAYTIAIGKSQDLSEEVAQTLTELRDGVLEEVKLHAGYARTLGVSEADMKTPNPATLKYTTFLLQTAQEKVISLTQAPHSQRICEAPATARRKERPPLQKKKYVSSIICTA